MHRYIRSLSAALLLSLLAGALALPAAAQQGAGGGAAPAPAPVMPGLAPPEGQPGEPPPDEQPPSDQNPDQQNAEGQSAKGGGLAQPILGAAQVQQAFHHLGTNDYLRITVLPDNLSIDIAVDGDGNISLPYINDVPVAGKTIAQLRADLTQRFLAVYKAPVVNVLLLSVGQIDLLVIYPNGQLSPRPIGNDTTLADEIHGLVPGGLRYRYAVLVRGGEALYNRLVGLSAVLAAPVPQPALPAAEIQSAVGQVAVPVKSFGHAAVPSIPPGQARPPVPPQNAAPSGVLAMPLPQARYTVAGLIAEPGVQHLVVDIAQLLRGGRYDIYNQPLQYGDVIFLSNTADLSAIPQSTPLFHPATRLVRISGVPQSGDYALNPGEGLRDLLTLSGFTESPSLDLRNVLLERRDAGGVLRRVVLNLDPAGPMTDIDKVELAHRDTVSIVPYIHQVFVVGDVKNPGVMGYNPLSKAMDYLAVAQPNMPTAQLKYIAIVRQRRDVGAAEQQPQVFRVNLFDEQHGIAQPGYDIEPGDIIFVPQKGHHFALSDVTGPLNTIFLGLNYFQKVNQTTTPNPGASSVKKAR